MKPIGFFCLETSAMITHGESIKEAAYILRSAFIYAGHKKRDGVWAKERPSLKRRFFNYEGYSMRTLKDVTS